MLALMAFAVGHAPRAAAPTCTLQVGVGYSDPVITLFRDSSRWVAAFISHPIPSPWQSRTHHTICVTIPPARPSLTRAAPRLASRHDGASAHAGASFSADCCERCVANPNCLVSTWNNAAGSCALHSNASLPRKSPALSSAVVRQYSGVHQGGRFVPHTLLTANQCGVRGTRADRTIAPSGRCATLCRLGMVAPGAGSAGPPLAGEVLTAQLGAGALGWPKRDLYRPDLGTGIGPGTRAGSLRTPTPSTRSATPLTAPRRPPRGGVLHPSGLGCRTPTTCPTTTTTPRVGPASIPSCSVRDPGRVHPVAACPRIQGSSSFGHPASWSHGLLFAMAHPLSAAPAPPSPRQRSGGGGGLELRHVPGPPG